MSTSIKIVGEFQNQHGKWLPLNQEVVNEFWPPSNQNYNIFCAWAGVRREIAEDRVGYHIPTIAERRGLPTDWNVEKDAPGCIHGLGFHQDWMTWVTIAEIVAYDWSILGDDNDDLRKKAMEVWPDTTEHEKIRLVMGFD